MATTYELIASVTVDAGGASSADFTSIPSTYTDLLLYVSGRSNRSATDDGASIKFNTLTTNFTMKQLYGYGSGVGSTGGTYGAIGTFPAASATGSTFGNIEVYISNYASSNAKSYSSDSVFENNATYAEADLIAGLWSNANPISGISVYCGNGGNFVQYSSFYLYGIKNS